MKLMILYEIDINIIEYIFIYLDDTIQIYVVYSNSIFFLSRYIILA